MKSHKANVRPAKKAALCECEHPPHQARWLLNYYSTPPGKWYAVEVCAQSLSAALERVFAKVPRAPKASKAVSK